MHSFNSCLMHCAFSAKERRPWYISDMPTDNSLTWLVKVTNAAKKGIAVESVACKLLNGAG